jgi:hypothetical protein
VWPDRPDEGGNDARAKNLPSGLLGSPLLVIRAAGGSEIRPEGGGSG